MSHSIRSAAMVVMILGCAGQSFAQCLPVWVKMNPANSPSPRFSTAAATFNGEGVLFGGLGPNNAVSGELWTWNGSNWTLRVSDPSAGRYAGAGATITLSDGMVDTTTFAVLGGVGPTGSLPVPLLRWLGGTTFDQFVNPLFTPRFNHGWAGTPNPGGLRNLALGGGICAGMIQDAKQITISPSPNVPPPFPGFYRRSNMATVWDTQLNRAVVVHGIIGPDPCFSAVYDGITAAWSPTAGWSVIPNQIQPTRANLAGAYSDLLGDVVVFGGDTQLYPSPNGLLGDTWLLRGTSTNWVQLTGTGPSPRRAYNNISWVPSQGHFVLFGGHDGGLSPEGAANGGFLGDTWILTYRPVYTLPVTSRTICPTQEAALQVSVAGVPTTTSNWQFRIIFAASGQDTGWIDPQLDSLCNQIAPCFFNGNFYGTINNGCTTNAAFSRLPALALADRIFFRYAATTACEPGNTFSPQMEVSFLPDLNADNAVNTADLIAFLGSFGQSTAPGQAILLADFNGDRVVNTPDLIFLLGRFGRSCD